MTRDGERADRSDDLQQQVAYARKRGSATARRVGLHALAYVQPAPRPERPVFIVGCPRSGTTLLSALLRRHPDLAGTRVEGHLLWSAHQHPARKGWGSDRSTAEDIARDERRFLYSAIRRISQGKRFLDKTPKNAVRVPYLNALFPESTFVFIKRDGRANVSSLIEGWTAGHGISCRVPRELDLGVYHGRYWCYILPPGWKEVTHSPLEEVAAFQFVATNEIALDDLEKIPRERVITVGFEDLLARPIVVAAEILDQLGLPPAPRVSTFAASLDQHHVSMVSPPRPDKWRDRSDQIERILPRIAPTMRRLGYAVEDVGR